MVKLQEMAEAMLFDLQSHKLLFSQFHDHRTKQPKDIILSSHVAFKQNFLLHKHSVPRNGTNALRARCFIVSLKNLPPKLDCQASSISMNMNIEGYRSSS